MYIDIELLTFKFEELYHHQYGMRRFTQFPTHMFCSVRQNIYCYNNKHDVC